MSVTFPSGVWAITPSAISDIQSRLPSADIAAAAPRPTRESSRLSVDTDGIVRIAIDGPMVRREGFLTHRLGFVSTDSIAARVSAASRDSKVRGIMLDIDSPGGSVSGLSEAADAILAARRVKPVIAQVSGMAASASYMLASQASMIFAGRTDTIGSIGTILMLYDESQAFQRAGVRAIPVTTGAYKAAGAPGVPITDAQIGEFQRIVDAYFKDFIASIMRGRGMGRAEVRAVADGRLFIGAEAQALGLIDGIKTTNDTMSLLRAGGRGLMRAVNQRAMRNVDTWKPPRMTRRQIAHELRMLELDLASGG